MALLNTAGFQSRRSRQRLGPVLQPKPVPMYFSNIPRGPIGALKKAIYECLPKWAILGVSFIAASDTEILCHAPLVDRLVATLQFFRHRHLPDYEPTKMANSEDPPATQRSYKAA